MNLQPGMRVRCVDASEWEYDPSGIRNGTEYFVRQSFPGGPSQLSTVSLNECEGRYAWSRFKPIVRVKAKCVPSLELLLKRSNDAWKALSSEEKEAMLRKQRESWVRGEMALSKMGLG